MALRPGALKNEWKKEITHTFKDIFTLLNAFQRNKCQQEIFEYRKNESDHSFHFSDWRQEMKKRKENVLFFFSFSPLLTTTEWKSRSWEGRKKSEEKCVLVGYPLSLSPNLYILSLSLSLSCFLTVVFFFLLFPLTHSPLSVYFHSFYFFIHIGKYLSVFLNPVCQTLPVYIFLCVSLSFSHLFNVE